MGAGPEEIWNAPAGWPTPPGRRRRRLRIGALSLVALLFAGCTAITVVAGPCSFDPPPGDVGTISVVNDTPAPVVVFDCAQDSCHSGEEGQRLQPAATAGRNYEMCTGASVGVADSTGVLLGCLVEPVGEPPPASSLAVSQLRPCVGAGPGPVRPSISA